MSFRQATTSIPIEGEITMPTVSNSELPGLLGLTALRKNRAILDLSTLKMYFVGPGDYDLLAALPPGTDCFQGEIAPSGHLVVPCCEFSAEKPEEHTLTLMTRPPGLEHRTPKRVRFVPPPPQTSAPEFPVETMPSAPTQSTEY
jgi:hypothetical protein